MRKWLAPSIIALAVIAFAIFRIVLPFGDTFTPSGVQLNTVDAYYFARYAEVWPNIPEHDYFYHFPEGVGKSPETIFPALTALSARVLNIDVLTAGAILPPILFLLTLLPVYVICRSLFKEKLIAPLAVLTAVILPGELMYRTMLGAADRHCLEILLFTIIMMFGILTAKNVQNIRKAVAYGLPTILFVWFYIVSWQGAVIALVILGLFLATWVCFSIRRWQTWTIVGCAVAGLLLLNIDWVTRHLILLPYIVATTSPVAETQPLFFTHGYFDLSIIIKYFGLTFYIALIGIGIVVQRYIKYQRQEMLLFLVWTLTMLLATISMRRFAYYLGINVAVLTAFTSVFLVKFFASNKANMAKVIVVLSLVICVPPVHTSTVLASSGYGIMPTSWQECTQWLRERADNNLYSSGGTGANLEKSDELNYGALSWWSYGQWIVQAGRTPVYSLPGGAREAWLLTKQDMASAVEQLREKEFKYVIIDEGMFKGSLYSILVSSEGKNINSTVLLERTLMYRLFYYNDIEELPLVWQSTDGKVKVFELVKEKS